MQNLSTLGTRFAAAASAFALSLVMISTTVTVPVEAHAAPVIASAYVSALA